MATAPLSNLTALWNSIGTTFKGISLDVTDTASAAGSLLMDLQVGGVSQFRVSKGGRVTAQTLTIGLGGQTAVATNTALGFEALHSASLTGANNAGAGYRALLNNATGASNVAVGAHAALYFNTSNNVAVGFEALRGSTTVANNTGEENTAVGYFALKNITSGSTNTGVGLAAGRDITTGFDNTALGTLALVFATTGTLNSAIGRSALQSLTTGTANVATGRNAGDVITTGARNTIVGANSDPSANNGNDQTVIGEGLTGKGDDTFFCGGTNGAYNEKNVTTWETTSDARIKKDIADLAGGLEVLEQIRVRTFRYRTFEEITDLPQSAAINQPGVQIGVIAQELRTVLPECVTENSTGVLSVNTDPLIWYLINAVKQLSAEIQTLKGL